MKMHFSPPGTENKTKKIPVWLQIFVTLCAASYWVILFRLFSLPAGSTFLGQPLSFLQALLVGLVFASTFIAGIMWLIPGHPLVFSFYQLLRFFRRPIAVLGSYLLFFLILKRIVPVNIRGAIAYLNIILVVLAAVLAEPVAGNSRLFSVTKVWTGFLNNLCKRLKIIPGWVLALLVSLLPAAITLGVLYLGMNVRLSQFRPYVWNDQIAYWTWIRSFGEYGFRVGYSVPNEMPAAVAFNHYGVNGPLLIMLYGSIAGLVGWSPQLPIVINLVMLTLIIFGFIHFMGLDARQTLVLGLFVTGIWTIILYLPTTSHETLNQVIGVILAVVFSRLLSGAPEPGRAMKVGTIGFLFLASMLRLSWALLFVPLIFLISRGKIWKRLLLSLFLSGILVVSAMSIFSYLIPPGNNIFALVGEAFKTGPQVIVLYYWDQFRQLIFDPANRIDFIIAYDLWILACWSAVRIVLWFRLKASSSFPVKTRTALFNLYNLGIIMASGLFVYIVDGFHRIFVPPLIVTVLVLISQKDYKPILAILVLNLAMVSPFAAQYLDLLRNFRPDIVPIVESQPVIDEWVIYDAETQNAWCNTVLLPLKDYDYRATIFPPGIGVSYLAYSEPIDYPFKSKYLLFDAETFDHNRDQLHVERLASLPIGDLYYNIDSACQLSSR